MTKILDFVRGKRTYIVAGVTFIMGGLQAIGYPIPEYVFVLLGATGLYTVRKAIG